VRRVWRRQSAANDGLQARVLSGIFLAAQMIRGISMLSIARARLIGIQCAIGLLAACTVAARSQEATTVVPQVDHHQHLLSPALARAWSQPEPVTADRLIAQQVRRYPDRLRAFCSINPLRDYALAELDRCSNDRNLRRGLKLQFANSQVNLRNAGHVEQVRQVFRAANAHRMAVVVHVWTGNDEIGSPYGRGEAQTFLNQILPMAPDIPIQIAHLGGSGPRLDPETKDAIVAFAQAVSAGDPRTRQLYFDITTNVIARSSAADAEFITARIREIGLQRILYGSDMAIGGNATAQESWRAHRAKLGLTEAEFKTIADNVAPYMRN
jgi:predicted TIM-barrel fold metal-dependent hydrolase